METTRRQFITGGLASALALLLAPKNILADEKKLEKFTKQIQEKNSLKEVWETGEAYNSSCVWNMGTPCSSDGVKKIMTFNNQLHIPMCYNHFEEHVHVMTLYQNNIKEPWKMEKEERRKEANKFDMTKTVL